MKFEDLRTRMGQRLYFRTQDLHVEGPPADHESVQLSHWARQGKVIRLKKGLYTMGADHRRRTLSALELAEPIYRPSYISLEWALSQYELIPEAVAKITSVSTLKTAHFRNEFGDFIYRHVHPDFFFGYTRQTLPAPHYLATPEKALLDFFHLSIPRSEKITAELLFEGYRLQNLRKLRKTHLRQAAARFNSSRVRKGAAIALENIGRSHA